MPQYYKITIMKKIYLVIIAITLVTGLHAQSSFHKSFSLAGKGGLLYRIIQTSDGGFASAGRVDDNASFDGDFLIIKTDAAGNASWIRQYPSADSEEFTDVIEVTGGGLVAAGNSFNMNTFLTTAVIVKFNADGVRLWSKKYSINAHSASARKIAKDDAGNIYVLGTVDVDGSSDDYFILKLDANGNILSQNTFGTPDFDYPLAFVRKGNGDFFICGWDNTFNGENIHLLKINADMTVAWSKMMSGMVKYFAYDMKELSGGDLVLAGRFDNGASSYDILLCTIDDSNGEQVWAKSYSAAEGFGIYAYGVAIGAGDEIVVTGSAENTGQGTFVMSANASGNLNWAYKNGAPGSSGLGYGIAPVSGGGYMVCGPLSNSNDAIVQLIKTSSDGTIPCNSNGFDLLSTPFTLPMVTKTVTSGTVSLSVQDLTMTESSFNNLTTICLGTGGDEMAESIINAGPNPSDGRFTITLPESYAGSQVKVVNTSGKEVFQGTMPSATGMNSISYTFTIDVPAGAYFVIIYGRIHQATMTLFINR